MAVQPIAQPAYDDSSDAVVPEDPESQDPNKVCKTVDYTPGALCSVDHTRYHYVPTTWVCALFTGLFILVLLGHVVQVSMRFKRGGFMILAALCALGEMVGWAARLRGASHPFAKPPYVAQMVCLILSPVFISAANYITFEKLQSIIGHEKSRLSAKVYFTIFLTGDIVSLVVQAVGGGMSAVAKEQSKLDKGTHIMIGGVIIQILVTVPFTLLFLDYHIRHYLDNKRNNSMGLNKYGEKVAGSSPWTNDIILVSLASGFSTMCILIRCIYRAIEMIQGWHGKLAVTEVYFCVLDGLMIFLSVLIFNFFHPGFRFGPPSEPSRVAQAEMGVHHLTHNQAAQPVTYQAQQQQSYNARPQTSAYPSYNESKSSY